MPFHCHLSLQKKKNILHIPEDLPLRSPAFFMFFCKHFNLDYKSVQSSHLVMSSCLWLHGLKHASLCCPSLTPGACSNSCPSRRWCHPTISPSVVLFSSRLQSFPASGSFPRSQFFPSGGQSIRVSVLASVFSMNIQDWFPLGLTGLISLLSKGL